MQIDFSQPFKTLTGSELKDAPEFSTLAAAINEVVSDPTLRQRIFDRAMEAGGKAVTLEAVTTNALLSPDDKATDMEKAQRYKLAFLIAGATAKSVEISLDDAALIKKLVGKHPHPLIVGQAFAMLEGEKPADAGRRKK